LLILEKPTDICVASRLPAENMGKSEILEGSPTLFLELLELLFPFPFSTERSGSECQKTQPPFS